MQVLIPTSDEDLILFRQSGIIPMESRFNSITHWVKHLFLAATTTFRMKLSEQRVLALIRDAFKPGVTLGSGVGLLQAQGIDDYASAATLAEYRERDEKDNWSAIPAADLDRNYSSLSFFDADGMRFHLPAYLVATLERLLQTADVTFHLVYFADGSESRYFRTLTKKRSGTRYESS